MRTQIYEHRSGLKVVPNDIIADVEKIIWDINPTLSKNQQQTSKNLYESGWKKKGGQANIVWMLLQELQFHRI